MKTNKVILLLIIVSFCFAASIATFSNEIPEKLLMPIVACWAMFITLIGLYVSSLQWQKGRLETEFLKEQFRLLNEYLTYLQGNQNGGFSAIFKEGKTYIGRSASFSPINFQALREIDQFRYIVQHFPPEHIEPQIFKELDNQIIYHPFFPHPLFKVLSKLDTSDFLNRADYAKHWYKDEFVKADEQFVMTRGARKEDLEKKPLRFPYNNAYLRVSDVISIYEEFNEELKCWLKKNHITTEGNYLSIK